MKNKVLIGLLIFITSLCVCFVSNADENDEYLSYRQIQKVDENGTAITVEDKTHTKGLKSYVENLIVPENVEVLELISRFDYNSTHTVDEFSENTTAGIKTIRFETKKAITVVDQSYYKSLETVYGYEGTGADTFAENVGAEFISLGKADTEINQFKYEIIDNEYIAITGLNKTAPYKVEFPEYIEGLPVKVIKDGTLDKEMNTSDWGKIMEITDVVIPSTVELVEKSAFSGCNLTTITVYSKNIEFLNEFTFYWCGTKLPYSPTIYAYDESGMKELVSEDKYVSLNKTEILKVDTITNILKTDDKEITVLPTKSKIDIQDFIQDKFIDNNYNFEIKDMNGEIKESGKIGSKNIITVKDEQGNTLAEYTVVVLGDVTGNGYSRMYDAFQILKDSLFNGNLDDIDMLIRDYDGNGYVRMYDAFQFLKDSLFN